MKYYGWDVDNQYRSTKESDAIRYRPTRRWYTRYLHKKARMSVKLALSREIDVSQ